MSLKFSRRALTCAAAAAIARPLAANPAPERATWAWVYPMGRPGDVPGNGLYLRHAFATENTSFYPGGWHTGENYYLLQGESAGAEVYAAADGEIVYAGFDYPGPVVIIRHEHDLYSMYGHLDDDLDVDSGPVRRGQRLGTVLYRTDGRSPSHLHFEIRRFLTTPEVNGATPRYSFTCGTNCPPGPGYWPIDAPEHPVAMGWLNPLHAMAARSFPDGIPDGGVEVMVAEGAPPAIDTWDAPDAGNPGGTIDLVPGARFRLVGIEAGDEETTQTSAGAYRLWYRIIDPGTETPVWVRALEPSDDALGSDGRPSSLRFNLLPAIQVAVE